MSIAALLLARTIFI